MVLGEQLRANPEEELKCGQQQTVPGVAGMNKPNSSQGHLPLAFPRMLLWDGQPVSSTPGLESDHELLLVVA